MSSTVETIHSEISGVVTVAREVTGNSMLCEFDRGLSDVRDGSVFLRAKAPGRRKREREAAFPRGREFPRGIVTQRNERLETTARERKEKRVVFDCIAQRRPLEVVSPLAEAG